MRFISDDIPFQPKHRPIPIAADKNRPGGGLPGYSSIRGFGATHRLRKGQFVRTAQSAALCLQVEVASDLRMNGARNSGSPYVVFGAAFPGLYKEAMNTFLPLSVL